MKKITLLLAFILLLTTVIAGCGSEKEEETTGTRTVIDAVGREVELPEEVNTVIPLANALRMMCYADALDMVAGVENAESEKTLARAYNWINYDVLKGLPVVGEGGSGGYTPYVEEILAVNPDVIICGYTEEDAVDLQEKTGIPVVVINGGNLFADDYDESLRIIGEVCGKEERCEEVIKYIAEIEEDFIERTSGIDEEEKPLVYAGAVTFKGGHGIEGTYTNFPIFNVLNVKDIFDESYTESTGVTIEKEIVLSSDPDIIFLDPYNMSIVNQDFNTNQNYYNSLKAFNSENIYTMLGFNNYYTNVEIALADSYYAGTVIYPDEFSDIDAVEKANEIFEFMLGSETYYDDLEDGGFGFGKITIGE